MIDEGRQTPHELLLGVAPPRSPRIRHLSIILNFELLSTRAISDSFPAFSTVLPDAGTKPSYETNGLTSDDALRGRRPHGLILADYEMSAANPTSAPHTLVRLSTLAKRCMKWPAYFRGRRSPEESMITKDGMLNQESA